MSIVHYSHPQLHGIKNTINCCMNLSYKVQIMHQSIQKAKKNIKR